VIFFPASWHDICLRSIISGVGREGTGTGRTEANAGAVALLLFAFSFLLGAVPARAGHPLETDDPGTQGRGNIEAEFNVDRANGQGGGHTTLVYANDTLGLAPRLDLVVVLPYIFDQADASTPTVRGMSDISASGLFTAIAGWERGEAGVYANMRYLLAGRPIGSPEKHDRIVASVAGRVLITERVVALGEYVWDDPIGAGEPPRSELSVGGSIGITENLSVNGAVKWGTTSSSSDVVYLMGVTYDFRGGEPDGKNGN
jgi:hypothetical protein